MQASSLIFLVIIAVWAAYFIQYWVRRREHLATAQAVDRLSEAMRVLERRSLPSEAGSRSYAGSPARAGTRGSAAGATVGAVTADAARAAVPAQQPAASDSRTRALRRAAGNVRTRGPRPGRRTRSLLFLTALAGLVAASVLAALGLLPWWSVAVPSVLAVAGFWWLRRGVRAARAVSRAAPSRRPAATSAARARGSARKPGEAPGGAMSRAEHDSATYPRRSAAVAGAPPAPAARHDQPAREVRHEQPSPTPPLERPTQAARGEELYDIEATADPLLPPPPPPPPPPPVRYALVDEDDIPLTWDPVPVPRPTYTMKSRASRSEPEAAEVAPEARLAPEAGRTAYGLQPERRAASL